MCCPCVVRALFVCCPCVFRALFVRCPCAFRACQRIVRALSMRYVCVTRALPLILTALAGAPLKGAWVKVDEVPNFAKKTISKPRAVKVKAAPSSQDSESTTDYLSQDSTFNEMEANINNNNSSTFTSAQKGPIRTIPARLVHVS